MSAAILIWPIVKWTHACDRFIPSTAGSPRWCRVCSFSRHAHKRPTRAGQFVDGKKGVK